MSKRRISSLFVNEKECELPFLLFYVVHLSSILEHETFEKLALCLVLLNFMNHFISPKFKYHCNMIVHFAYPDPNNTAEA